MSSTPNNPPIALDSTCAWRLPHCLQQGQACQATGPDRAGHSLAPLVGARATQGHPTCHEGCGAHTAAWGSTLGGHQWSPHSTPHIGNTLLEWLNQPLGALSLMMLSPLPPTTRGGSTQHVIKKISTNIPRREKKRRPFDVLLIFCSELGTL